MENGFELMPKLHGAIFREKLVDSVTLAEIGIGVVEVLKSIQASGEDRIGFVSGIITSDGEKLIGLNIKRLSGYTEFLRKANAFPMFSATDVFDEELIERVGHNAEKEWFSLWRTILSSGHITDLFMTPRWKESRGAKDEYEAARESKMKIHNMEGDPELISIMNSHKMR